MVVLISFDNTALPIQRGEQTFLVDVMQSPWTSYEYDSNPFPYNSQLIENSQTSATTINTSSVVRIAANLTASLRQLTTHLGQVNDAAVLKLAMYQTMTATIDLKLNASMEASRLNGILVETQLAAIRTSHDNLVKELQAAYDDLNNRSSSSTSWWTYVVYFGIGLLIFMVCACVLKTKCG